MTTRKIHAIKIKLRSPQWLEIVVWPFEDRERCCRLINSKRTWLITAGAGDAVLVKRDKSLELERFYIESVSLFLVNPVECNGTIVETA